SDYPPLTHIVTDKELNAARAALGQPTSLLSLPVLSSSNPQPQSTNQTHQLKPTTPTGASPSSICSDLSPQKTTQSNPPPPAPESPLRALRDFVVQPPPLHVSCLHVSPTATPALP